MELFTIYEQLGLSRAVWDRGEAVLAGLTEKFRAIDQVAEYNQAKVLSAMQAHRIGANHFAATTGYGYNDDGRERLECVRESDAILREAARIAAEGVDEDYFRRIRKASFGANLRGLNSFENIAVTLTEGYFHGYDPLRFPEVFESITPEDVAAFLKTNVTAERMVLSRIVPKQ